MKNYPKITTALLCVLVALLISIFVTTRSNQLNSADLKETRRALFELQRKVGGLNPNAEQYKFEQDEVQRRLTELKRGLSDAQSKQVAHNASDATTDSQNESPATNPRDTASELTATEMALETSRTEFIATTLDNVLLQEPLDAGWAGTAETQVGTAIDNMGHTTDSELYGVQCQSTLCRIEAGHDNETAEMDFTLELGKLDAFRDAHAFIRRIENADGSIDTITYISRAGYALPDLAANQ